MSASIWSPKVGMPLPVRTGMRLHLKHATHWTALVNGVIIGIDNTGFTVSYDGYRQGADKVIRGEKVHYRFSQADGFVLGNRPYVQDES